MALDLRATFDKFESEFLKFDRVKGLSTRRPDLYAFVLLDQLVPGARDLIVSAEHDEIWLDIDPAALAEVASEDDICTLVRCGVRWDNNIESLALFV